MSYVARISRFSCFEPFPFLFLFPIGMFYAHVSAESVKWHVYFEEIYTCAHVTSKLIHKDTKDLCGLLTKETKEMQMASEKNLWSMNVKCKHTGCAFLHWN